MNGAITAIRSWGEDVAERWDRFWFTPAAPHTLALIRMTAGAMLFYTHLVWSKDLLAFLGPSAWIPAEVSLEAHRGSYAWSHLWYIESPSVLWTLHLAALAVFALLTIGLFSRVVSVLAFLITVAYCHRLEGALFGLDQVNAMLAMYLMLAPSGAVYSVDAWLARRRDSISEPAAQVSTNVAIRLIQLHMCVIYLFGGIGKMRGELWWDGSALWYSLANLEYQSLDLTWIVQWPQAIALLTHLTVFWETFYVALIWNRVTRPIMLLMAVAVHGGIAIGLGMITFGLAMLIGNLAFIEPSMVRRVVDAASRQSRAGGSADAAHTAAPPNHGRIRPRRRAAR